MAQQTLLKITMKKLYLGIVGKQFSKEPKLFT